MEQLIERVNKLATPVKAGIIAGIVLVVTAATYFFFIQDLETNIEGIKNEQAAKDQVRAEKQAIADNLSERRRQMDELEQKFLEALTQLPEKKDIEELLSLLNEVGRKSGLEIGKVTPGAESSKGFYSAIPISMSVQGNYHEIALFLQEVAGLRRIVNVSNIKLGTPLVKGDKVSLSSEFLATTFRFTENKADAKGKGGAK